MVYNANTQVFINNEQLQTIPVNDTFTYLGELFTASGLSKINYNSLKQDLEIVRNSPCKPQQK